MPRSRAWAVALAVLGLAVPAWAQRSFPDTTHGVVVFDDQLATWNMTEAQFAFAASHYAGTQKVRRDDARHLRQYNPGFLVLHYRLGQALGHSIPSACQPTTNYLQIIDGNQWVQEWPGDGAVQESWFFHYGNGPSRVFSCSNGHYVMEIGDAGWRAWWSGQLIQQLQDNEDDGVFADSYSIPNYFGGSDFNPPLPDVDATFESQWAAWEHAFTDYIRGQLAGRWKWIPNIGALVTSRDPSDYSNVDGAMIEGFAEWGGGNYLDPADWALQLNRVLSLVHADKILIAQTYPDASDVGERLFVLGTYLLIKGAHTYVNMDTGLDPEWFPEYAVALGRPVDPLPVSISGLFDPTWNVYVRHYSQGMVLVNPSASPRGVINLGGTFARVVPVGGGAVPADGSAPGSLSYTSVTSLTLQPHEAVILLNDSDLIFKDGVESADFAAWSRAVGGGDLAVSTGAAAMDGTHGVSALVNDTESLYVEDGTPSDEGRYRARFLFDPAGFDPGEADGHLRTRIFIAFEESPNRRLVTVVLRRLNGQYGIMGRVHLDDGTFRDTAFVAVSDAPHSVQLDWKRSTSPTANNGYLQLWVDATTVSVTGLDNSLGAIDFARLGAMSVKTGAAGMLLFDKFESRRLNLIVP